MKIFVTCYGKTQLQIKIRLAKLKKIKLNSKMKIPVSVSVKSLKTLQRTCVEHCLNSGRVA